MIWIKIASLQRTLYIACMKKSALFNSSLSQAEFLQNYWNQKPCLFKGVLQEAGGLASPDELFELALDEDFETRLALLDENGKRKLTHGPLETKHVAEARRRDHALICHNLNALAPEFYELEKMVDFIPKWEFDDVMGVVSNRGMSLGAHIDNYNVFILQGQGKRRWEIQENPKVSWRQDQEIKVLEEFAPDYAWELQTGDMIYIPPGIAHHGISLEDSVSYSLGFKSLETIDVLGEYMANLKEADRASGFYKNPSFNVFSKSDVPPGAADFFQQEAGKLFGGDDFKLWLARRLSASKNPIEPTGAKAPASYHGMNLQRDVHLRYCRLPARGKHWVCFNESCRLLDESQTAALLPVLESNPFESFQIEPETEVLLKDILDELFESGCIFEIEQDRP